MEAVTAIVAILAIALGYLYTRMKRTKLPPGPPALPILGSLPFIDKKNLRQELVRLSKEHNSDVISVKFGPRLVVFLTSFEAIEEAFSGDDFPDRPDSIFFLVSDKQGLGSSDGALWKTHRQISVSLLRDLGQGKMAAEEKITEETRQLCAKLEQLSGSGPADLGNILNHASANVVSTNIVGKRYDHEDAEFFEHVAGFKDMLLSMGSSLLGMFPSLRHLPGNLFGFVTIKQKLEHVYKGVEEHMRQHKECSDRENIADFLDGYLAEQERQEERNPNKHTFTDEQIKNVVTDLFEAGCDTGAITLQWGILMMMAHPKVQQKVQKEIDEVLGKDRLPTMSDLENLPYTEATVLETHRWGTLACFGLPHCNQHRDVTFRNFTIPQGTMVIGNIWAVHRDPKSWPFPGVFNPWNFLDGEGKVVHRKELIPFGIGRRECPGAPLAKMAAFLMFTSLLQRFTFSLPEGADLPELEGVLKTSNKPHQHEVCVTPRCDPGPLENP